MIGKDEDIALIADEDIALIALAGLPQPQRCSLRPGGCRHYARYGDSFGGMQRGVQNYCACCADELAAPDLRPPIYHCDGSIYHD